MADHKPFVPVRGYAVVDFVASGGQGTVWVVKRWRGSGDHFACKQIARRNLDNELPELLILRRTQHMNVMKSLADFTTIDVGPDQQQRITTSIILPLCRIDLFHLVHNMFKGPVPVDCFSIIASDICHGFSYLHNARICHSDFKTENSLIDANFNVLITDFGHSRIQPPEHRVQQFAISTLATPLYMAPEALTTVHMNHRQGHQNTFDGYSADKYSVGATLFELSTGRVPFPLLIDVDDYEHMIDQLMVLRLHMTIRDHAYPELDNVYTEEKAEFIINFLHLLPHSRPQWPAVLEHDFIRMNYGTEFRKVNLLPPLSRWERLKKWLGLA